MESIAENIEKHSIGSDLSRIIAFDSKKVNDIDNTCAISNNGLSRQQTQSSSTRQQGDGLSSSPLTCQAFVLMCLLVVLCVCESGGAHRHRPRQLRQLLAALAARPLRPAPSGRRDHAPAPGSAPGVHRAELVLLEHCQRRLADSGGWRQQRHDLPSQEEDVLFLAARNCMAAAAAGGTAEPARRQSSVRPVPPPCGARALSSFLHAAGADGSGTELGSTPYVPPAKPRGPDPEGIRNPRTPPPAKGAVERAGRGSGRAELQQQQELRRPRRPPQRKLGGGRRAETRLSA